MTRKEKKDTIAEMRKTAKEFDRRGDIVLRDQMLRAIAEALATW